MKTNLKNKNTFIKIFAIVLIILFCGVLFLPEDFFSKKNASSYTYKQFYEMIGEGKIQSVKINEKSLEFTLKDDVKTKYKVQNPSSQTLEEYLLMNDVEFSENSSATDIISTIFDIIFYLIFFVAIFFVFRKFISPNTFKVQHKTGVKFDDVVGMESLKRDMKQVIEIMKNPTEYAKKGIRMPKGILLEGAPGNGKTLFAKALAGECKVNFIPAKATDFESMFMAIGPMKVKLLFKKARKKAPCIVFIDEFDGIGTVRNYSGSAIETENTRIVTALLNELDGFERTDGVLVLAATNSIQALDSALIRPGRFDSKFSVPYPDFEAREKLCEMYCKEKKLEDDVKFSVLAKLFDGASCATIESVLNRAALISSQKGNEKISLVDIQNALKEN